MASIELRAAQQALEQVQEFKRRWWLVPAFGNKVNKATREAITNAHSPIFELEHALRAALTEPPEPLPTSDEDEAQVLARLSKTPAEAYERGYMDGHSRGVEAERERCARICDNLDVMSRDPMVCRGSAQECAEAIRAALAEPTAEESSVVEPVACEWPSCGCRVDLGEDWKACRPEAPPLQHKPLTEDEISEIANRLEQQGDTIRQFARAIERAHKIGGKE